MAPKCGFALAGELGWLGVNTVKRYSNLPDLINLLHDRKSELEERIAALQSGPKTTEESILFKYIETRSTIKAAAYAKENGVRSPKGTAYAPSDVSDLIEEGHHSLNSALLKFAREIFRQNKKSVMKRHG